MSEIRATTVSDLAGTGPATLTKQSAAKAWIDYSRTAVEVSFNVSSLTDNGSGDHTVNFTNSFSSANFVPATGGRYSSSYHGIVTVGDRAAGSVDLFGMTGNASATYLGASYKSDLDLVAAAVHGDLA